MGIHETYREIHPPSILVLLANIYVHSNVAFSMFYSYLDGSRLRDTISNHIMFFNLSRNQILYHVRTHAALTHHIGIKGLEVYLKNVCVPVHFGSSLAPYVNTCAGLEVLSTLETLCILIHLRIGLHVLGYATLTCMGMREIMSIGSC